MTVAEFLETLPEHPPEPTPEAWGIEWNYDVPQPWTKEQAEAWDSLLPRESPLHLFTATDDEKK